MGCLQKKRSSHISSFRDRGRGEGGQKRLVSEIPEMSDFFNHVRGKNRQFLKGLETKGGGGLQFCNCLEKT